MQFLLFLLVVLPLMLRSRGDLKTGKCPKLKPVYVDQASIGGRWYELKRADTLGEPGRRCNFANYTLVQAGSDSYIRVNNTALNGDSYRTSINIGKQFDPSIAAFNFDAGKWAAVVSTTAPNTFILFADEHFVLLYSCQGVGSILHMELAWIMSRERFPENRDDRSAKVESVLSSFGITVKLDFVNQENCPPIDPVAEKTPEKKEIPFLLQLLSQSRPQVHW